MRIPEEIVEQVRDHSDFLGIVEDYTRMKKVGSRFMGLCPFHDEKTPSFNVNPQKGFFKCFGCGIGGNVITFVMEKERLEFVDAVRWLASRMGIKIPEQVHDREAFEKKETVYHALRFASEYYMRNLQEPTVGKQARDYIAERGLTQKTVERFKLGYATESWDGLLKEAERGHIKQETLVRAGLVVKREEREGYYDRFRGRLIFPIWSHVGKIVGFGGRILADVPNTPKYINSTETEVYSKKEVLYGLYQSKRTARSHEKVLLVEGYTDVLALDQAGIGSVASCGTALTAEQVRLLTRYVNEIQLLYDADNAGIEATTRAIDCALENGLDASVIRLPPGEDPDSFVQRLGADEFKEYLASSSKNWVESLYLAADSKNALSSIRGKIQELSEIARRIAMIEGDLVKKQYIKEASRLFDIAEGDVLQEVNRHLMAKPRSTAPAPTPPVRNDPTDNIPEPEKKILQLMMENGAPMINFILPKMSLEEFQDGPSHELAEALSKLCNKYDERTLEAIQNGKLDVSQPTQQLIGGLMIHQHEISKGWEEKKIAVPELNQDSMRVAKECMRRNKQRIIKNQMTELARKVLNSDEGSADQLGYQEEYRQKSLLLKVLDREDCFDDEPDADLSLDLGEGSH